MISRIQPGALRRRAGYLAVAGLLAGGLFIAAGQMPALAASGGVQASVPPAVDITFKNQNPPRYPMASVKNREQGRVMLDVIIDAHGNVAGVAVQAKGTTASARLQTAAMVAAANWKFTPGMKNGTPVGGEVRIPVDFALDPKNGVAGHCPAGFLRAFHRDKTYTCVREQPQASAASAAS